MHHCADLAEGVSDRQRTINERKKFLSLFRACWGAPDPVVGMLLLDEVAALH